MIDGSEKPNRQLDSGLQNSHVCESAVTAVKCNTIHFLFLFFGLVSPAGKTGEIGAEKKRMLSQATCVNSRFRFSDRNSILIQEPMTWSKQLQCAHVTAFSRTSLFLELFGASLEYYLNSTKQSAKPTDLTMIFSLLIESFPF